MVDNFQICVFALEWFFVCLMLHSVGQILAKYRSGKLPKAFKVIPSLANWEDVSCVLSWLLTSPHINALLPECLLCTVKPITGNFPVSYHPPFSSHFPGSWEAKLSVNRCKLRVFNKSWWSAKFSSYRGISHELAAYFTLETTPVFYKQHDLKQILKQPMVHSYWQEEIYLKDRVFMCCC